MKTNNKLSAYILRGSTTALLFSCVIVALCSAINLPEPPKARPPRGNAVFGANGHASVASMPASASDNARKSARFKFASSRQRVGGREIAGFSARQAPTGQEENLIPPAGLKPVEQEAWLAMARRQEASGGIEFTSFYPARYNEPFVVQGEGVRVAVRPVGGKDVKGHIDNHGQVIYRGAYRETET